MAHSFGQLLRRITDMWGKFQPYLSCTDLKWAPFGCNCDGCCDEDPPQRKRYPNLPDPHSAPACANPCMTDVTQCSDFVGHLPCSAMSQLRRWPGDCDCGGCCEESIPAIGGALTPTRGSPPQALSREATALPVVAVVGVVVIGVLAIGALAKKARPQLLGPSLL